MTDPKTVAAAREALLNLPLLYVYLQLEVARRPQALDIERAGRTSRSAGFDDGSAPVRDKITGMMVHITTVIPMMTTYLMNELGPGRVAKPLLPFGRQPGWLLDHLDELAGTPHGDACLTTLVTLHQDVRETLGINRYVQHLVAPCPACDMRALVRPLDGPVITCEACAHTMDDPAYLAVVSTYRTDE